MSDANISDEGQDGQEYEVLLKAADILAREFDKCKDSKLLVEIERDKLQDENKKMREALKEVVLWMSSEPKNRLIKKEEEIIDMAIKLLNS